MYSTAKQELLNTLIARGFQSYGLAEGLAEFEMNLACDGKGSGVFYWVDNNLKDVEVDIELNECTVDGSEFEYKTEYNLL